MIVDPDHREIIRNPDAVPPSRVQHAHGDLVLDRENGGRHPVEVAAGLQPKLVHGSLPASIENPVIPIRAGSPGSRPACSAFSYPRCRSAATVKP